EAPKQEEYEQQQDQCVSFQYAVPSNVIDILNSLQSAGYCCYLTGRPLTLAMLGLPSGMPYQIVTNAPWIEIAKYGSIFPGFPHPYFMNLLLPNFFIMQMTLPLHLVNDQPDYLLQNGNVVYARYRTDDIFLVAKFSECFTIDTMYMSSKGQLLDPLNGFIDLC